MNRRSLLLLGPLLLGCDRLPAPVPTIKVPRVRLGRVRVTHFDRATGVLRMRIEMHVEQEEIEQSLEFEGE